jgi:hypothetical protein
MGASPAALSEVGASAHPEREMMSRIERRDHASVGLLAVLLIDNRF